MQSARLRNFKKNYKLVYYGIPILGATALITYCFSYISQIRYDVHDKRTKSLSRKDELGIDANKKPVDIQEIYFELMKNRDLDDWDMVRVTRPEGQENDGILGK